MKNYISKRLNLFLALLVFFSAMAVYLFTLAPSITMEDSAELITAAYTLGIPHPSGYPLYVLLGKLFTFIPLGTIAWRVNLMSAVFGALTAGILYLVIEKISKNKFIALCLALVLAFSQVFWSQCVVSKFYTLNSFLICWLILMLLAWSEKKNSKYLLAFAFIYGLSLTNHTTVILLAPAFGLYILLIDKTIIKNWRLILSMFLLFLAGLSVYWYIPWRAAQKAEFNWGPISNWQDVIVHITRAQYNDFSPFANNYGKTGIVISFLAQICQQFFLPTLLLALGGAAYLWQKNKPVLVLTAGVFLLNSLGIIYLRKYGWMMGIDYTYRVYYLPAYCMVVIWLAVITSYLYNFLVGIFSNRPRAYLVFFKALFSIIVFSLPVSFLVSNYKINDLSGFWFNYDYTKNLLNSLEPKSVYYFAYDGSLQGDTEIFSLLYFQLVEHLRPDVDVISEQNFFYKKVYLNLPKEYFKLDFVNRRKKMFELLDKVKDRPLYANFAVTTENNNSKMFGLPNIYAYRYYPSLEIAKKNKLAPYLAPLRNLDAINEFSDYPSLGLAAHYYYNLAAFYLVTGQKSQSQISLIKAFNLDTAPYTHEYTDFLVYRSDWLGIKNQAK